MYNIDIYLAIYIYLHVHIRYTRQVFCMNLLSKIQYFIKETGIYEYLPEAVHTHREFTGLRSCH